MIDLEFEILSIAALNQHVFPLVIENEHLFVKWHGLYSILYSMYDEGVNFSYPSIHNRIIEVKGSDYADNIIAQFAKSTGTSTGIKDYINQLKRQQRLESVRDLAIDIQEGIKKNTLTLEQIEAMIADEFDKIDTIADDGIMFSDYAKQTLDEIFPSAAAHKSGIHELDDKLYGVKDGQVMIIAARPSKGKTALALQFIENMALNNDDKKTILLFSMDATKDELYSRYLSRRARVESWKIEFKKMNDEEAERVLSAHAYYRDSGYKIKMYDSIADINVIKAKIKKEKNVHAVVIDYIQQIVGGSGDTREAEVASISRTCKNMAMTMHIPFILLSQLNRSIEIHNREPLLSDLRESGAIEQDANIVLFIHSSDEEKQKDIEDSNFYLAKNKNGRTGKILTNFNKPYFEFGIIPKEENDYFNN